MAVTYLKVKIKSLAAEARIIRLEERRAKTSARWQRRHNHGDVDAAYNLFFSLRHHRQWDVRREARAAQIAYGFLRGTPYAKIEQPKRNPVDGLNWQRIVELASKYGPDPNRKDVSRTIDLWRNFPVEKAA